MEVIFTELSMASLNILIMVEVTHVEYRFLLWLEKRNTKPWLPDSTHRKTGPPS